MTSAGANSPTFADPPKPVPDVSEEKIKRDRYGRYIIPDPETGKERSWTRATTWAKTISDTYRLHKWQERMVATGLVMRPDLHAQASFAIQRADRDNIRDELDKICEEAKNAAGSKVGANLGTALHGFTEKRDRGEEIRSLPDLLRSSVDSYSAALDRHHMFALPDGIERVIIVPELGVAGRLDRIMTNTAAVGKWDEPGAKFIGDVKTAANIGYSWMEVSIQLAIYAHAAFIWNQYEEKFEPFPEVDQDEAIVMHMPVPESANAGYTDLYRINIRQGWEYALLAGQIRKARADKSLAFRLGEPVTSKPIPVRQDSQRQAIDWRARIDEATCRADLSAIWETAEARGEWNEDLEAYGHDKLKDLRG